MTTEELADRLATGVGEIKQLLRREFPDEDFRPPGKTLEPRHIRCVHDKLRDFMAERRARSGQVVVAPDEPPPVRSVAAVEPVPLGRASLPRAGGEHRVLLHRDVFNHLADEKEPRRIKSAVKRLLREILVEGRSQRRVKGTRGINAGWLRAPLGDNGGHHFYLWHALQGMPPVGDLDLARGDVVVRAIRHHDDHERLAAGSLADYDRLDARQYVETFEEELEGGDVLSTDQRQAFTSDAIATITKGHPGAGKTTVHLERTRRQAGAILFLTFGASQREQAERWLRTYAPAELRFEVWTHEHLLRTLDPGWTPPPPVEIAIATMIEALQGEMPRLGPWRRHPAALHAELRAHLWGRALPIRFRAAPPALTDEHREQSYRARRVKVLGEPAVEAALRAAAALPAEVRTALFGDLERTAQLAAALPARDPASLPPIVGEVTGVFIDEVQDLTLVEVLVGVLVAHAAARTAGRRPTFHAAGDEGQTVRPTDFDWGELKDLIHELLGPPEEFNLQGNVRSPRTLTHVINNSWTLYQAVTKAARPRGYAEAEVDESAVGQVLWVDARHDFPQVLEVIARTPGAALVYPGPIVPADLRADAVAAGVLHVLAAPEAKGLDFRAVFVIDAGKLAHKLYAAVPDKDEAAIAEIDKRLSVDSIRVAISRSTELIVFVERAFDADVRRRLTVLCGDGDGLLEGVATDVVAGDLERLVDIDTGDRTELVTELLAELDKIDDVDRRLQIASRARQLLGDPSRAGAVQGRLRKDVYGAHGLALLRVAVARATDGVDAGEQLRLANAAFNLAQEKELARLGLDLRDLLHGEEHASEKVVARVVQRAIERTAAGSGEAAAALRLYVGRVARQADATDLRALGHAVDALVALAPAAVLFGELETDRQAQLGRVLDGVLALATSAASTRLARRTLELLAAPTVRQRGAVSLREGHVDAAIAIFEDGGLYPEAVAAARWSGDDPQRALALARRQPDPALAVIERLARIHADLEALGAGDLTESEREHLLKRVRRYLADARATER